MVLKMIYDAKFFDEVFERRGHDATKWDYPLFVKDNKDIVPMWVADMSFAPAPSVTRALHERVDHPCFGYFDPSPAYYDAIVRWHELRNGVTGMRPEHIAYENGVLGGVVSTLRAYVQPGDAVLLTRH